MDILNKKILLSLLIILWGFGAWSCETTIKTATPGHNAGQITTPKLKPNVIIISMDSLRLDHLGCYGYQKATSPNIDKLGRENILFKQAIAQA